MLDDLEIAGITLLNRGELGFELEGDAESLRDLADALALAKDQTIRIHCEDGAACIKILRTGDLVVMQHRPSEVTLAGNAASLESLAASLRFVAAGPTGPSRVQFHAHVEWYDGHPWLDPQSEPVVVLLRS